MSVCFDYNIAIFEIIKIYLLKSISKLIDSFIVIENNSLLQAELYIV